MIRIFPAVVFATAMLCVGPTAYPQSNIGSVGHDCRDAYAGETLPNATAALLALERQCELAVQHYNQPHMEYELDQSRLALLRIHIALRSVTRSDRTLPKTIGSISAGDAAAILATIYKGKNAGKYESAIIRAAWLAVSSQVPGKAAESAIRQAITIYVGRGDYASAGKLIQHLEEPVLSNQTENGQLLIDLLQGRHALQVRDAITSLVGKWGSHHIAIIGPIDYVIAETYRSADNEKYRHWLNMAEGNDFKEASVELNRLFFDFEDYHQVISALRALGYDRGFDLAGDNVDRQALLRNISTFGAAALGSSLGSACRTTISLRN